MKKINKTFHTILQWLENTTSTTIRYENKQINISYQK
jgi:hypothetical protein